MEHTQNKSSIKDIKANIIVITIAVVSLIVVAVLKNS